MRIPADTTQAQAASLRDALTAHSTAVVETGLDMPVVTVPRENLVDLMQHLQGMPGGYEHCSMLTAVDHIGDNPRFEVVYGLYSVASNRWVRVKTHCPENDASVPTVTGVWPGTNWFERECFDMFGIQFQGHPDLRRILMPEGFDAHPLRKEYPRDGVEPDRLYREWEAGRAPVKAGEDPA